MASPISRGSRHPRQAQHELAASSDGDGDALTSSDLTSLFPQLNSTRGWRTASNGEELWTKFEVRRESAEYYLNLYFECMDSISADSASYDYGTMDEPPPDAMLHPTCSPPDGPRNNTMTKLKIYCDTILRELIVMEEIALFVQQAYASLDEPVIPPTTTIWTLGCCLTAAFNSSAVIVATSALGALAGGVALVAPPAWRAYHTKKLQDTVASLRDLKKTVADGLDPARHRHSLDASRFSSLERITESIQIQSSRAIEEET
ncbi:hypothetical protein QBC39DRAFT_365958 [Podospora conica]|nr:hypothetical protein QBC39DRAFT_365958 [Schizothecium conicum]